jgi:hypothetical protein
MKRSFIYRAASVLFGLGLVVLLGLGALVYLPGQAASAEPATTPQVTVYLKNYQAEYDLATTEFLEHQFMYANSPAFGLVNYTVVTDTLTTQALVGSSALIIDEGADMSLTEADAAVIHNFVNHGGKVGLFTYPRYYWDHDGPNQGAVQGIADLFGNAVIGEPNQAEHDSGDSSATVPEPEDGSSVSFTQPYSLSGSLVQTFDKLPFSPITSAGTSPVLVSGALGQLPAAVANSHGVLVTNSIGDAVQGGDASLTYGQFVVDAIVWLANTGTQFPNKLYLPVMAR